MDRRSFLATLAASFLFVPGVPEVDPQRRWRRQPVSTYWSWGLNTGAEAARGNLTSPASPAALSTLPATTTALGCGEGAGAAVTSAGEVYVFGQNSLIILGVFESSFGSQFSGVGARPPISTATKLTYPNAANAVASAVDASAVFWLKSDGTLWAVGENRSAFGNGDGADTYYSTPVQIASNVASFVVGQGGGSASALYYVDLSGDVWHSGSNGSGQAGNGTTSVRIWTFAKIAALSSVQKIWTSGESTFALSGGSTLKAWGSNSFGQLGDASTTTRTTPVTISTLPAAVTISDLLVSAAGFTYALLIDGRLFSTGFNLDGQLGLADTTQRTSFTQATVGASLAVSALASGGAGGPFSMAVVAGGKYWATGANTQGQIDYGFTRSLSFVNSISVGNVQAIVFVGDAAVFVRIGGSKAYAFILG